MNNEILCTGDIKKVLEILAETYPDAKCELVHATPFQLLAAVMLSAQTTDKKVNQVTDDLFVLYSDAKHMAEADPAEVERIIRPLGMYRTKTANLINMSRMLVEKYGGQVPEDQKLLEELPGIGRKSANVVMADAFGHQRIAVDTHVFRVSNRIGLVHEKNVTDTEKALMKVLPEDQWTANHHRLIWHGRKLCTARSPKCDACPLRSICLKYGMDSR
ncbi:MAG: endonuclease III [Eubacteriales bacterium]|nr:endonuclease III [Eubacteriales bacterium]